MEIDLWGGAKLKGLETPGTKSENGKIRGFHTEGGF